MQQTRPAVTRTWRRIALSYRLVCARDDRRRRHLRVPSGVWLCTQCERMLWDSDTFAVHSCRPAC